MIRQTMHNIANVQISEVQTEITNRGKDFHTRTIIAKDEDGNQIELVLFSDDKNSLKI